MSPVVKNIGDDDCFSLPIENKDWQLNRHLLYICTVSTLCICVRMTNFALLLYTRDRQTHRAAKQ